MTPELIAAALVVTWVLCGITTAVIASSRNRNPIGWGLLGCLLGVFALIMVVALPATPCEPPVPSYELKGAEWWGAVVGFGVILAAIIYLNVSLWAL